MYLQCEKECRMDSIKTHEHYEALVRRREQLNSGVGTVTASALISALSELGTLNWNEIAILAASVRLQASRGIARRRLAITIALT